MKSPRPRMRTGIWASSIGGPGARICLRAKVSRRSLLPARVAILMTRRTLPCTVEMARQHHHSMVSLETKRVTSFIGAVSALYRSLWYSGHTSPAGSMSTTVLPFRASL